MTATDSDNTIVTGEDIQVMGTDDGSSKSLENRIDSANSGDTVYL